MDDEMISAAMYPRLLGDFGASPRYCPFWLYVYTVQASTDELAIPACGQTRNWLDQGIYVQLILYLNLVGHISIESLLPQILH